jgi:hypothetical protein
MENIRVKREIDLWKNKANNTGMEEKEGGLDGVYWLKPFERNG